MIKAKKPSRLGAVERAVGALFSRIPVTPNQWTALSLLFGALGLFVSIYYQNLSQSLALFFAAFALDYVDGSVARYTGKTTRKGAYIDGISDRFVEAFIILGLMFYDIPGVLTDSKISLAVLLFLSTMTSYSRAYADHKKLVVDEGRLREMGGLLERFERVSILLAAIALSLYYGTQVISYAVLLLSLLAAVTVLQRIFYSIRGANK